MNFDFSFVKKMIAKSMGIEADQLTPALGLEMMKKGLENIVKEPVNHFEITYLNDSEEIWVRVWLLHGEVLRQYKESNIVMIIFLVKNIAKMQLKGDESLDILKCERLEDGKINLEIFTTENGDKKKTQILNYKP